MGLGLERHIPLGTFILAGERRLAAGHQQSLRAVSTERSESHTDSHWDSHFHTDSDWDYHFHADSDAYINADRNRY
jgi:hypothetical protein